MNINHIKYFVSVVEHGSFSAAAAEQFITAQGMSKAIADLENEIGSQLLVRKNRGVEPTPFGLEFYERSKLVMYCFDDLEEFTQNHIARPDTGTVFNLHVAVPTFVAREKVSMNVAKFISINLGVNTKVSFGTGIECLAALDRGDADAVITIGKADVPGYEFIVVGTLPCGIQISKRNPLSKQPTIRLADLADTPLALWPHYDFFNEAFVSMLEGRDIPFEPCAIDQTVKGVIKLLTGGGAMVVPRITALDVDYLQTMPVSFHPDENLNVPFCIVSPEGERTPANEALLRLVAQHGSRIAEVEARFTKDLVESIASGS